MSSDALKFVKSNRKTGLLPSDKLILAAIAFLIEDGQTACFASRNDVATETGLSIDTVKRSLKRLAEKLLIKRSTPCRGEGKGRNRKIEICGFSEIAEAQRAPVDGVQPAPINEFDGVQRAPSEGGSVHLTKGAACTPLYKEEQKRTEETGEDMESRAADATGPILDLLRPSPHDPISVFNSYNDLAMEVGLPLAKGLSPSRRRSIGARIREHGPASWEIVVANVRRSSFLQGRNDRGWRPPGFDWFLKPENYTKVFEGQYGNGAHAVPTRSNVAEQIRLLEALA